MTEPGEEENVNTASPQHAVAQGWLDDALSGDVRLGIPWHSLLAFLQSRHTRRPSRGHSP